MKDSKAFLFDMDGVVADTEPQYDLFLGELRDEYHLSPDFLKEIKGTRLPDILDQYFPDYSEAEKREIDNRVINFELNVMKYDPIPGVLEFIRKVKEEGFKIALVTSSLREKVKVALKELGLESTFDALVAGDDVVKGKPDPECYLLGAQRLRVKPEECIVLEDSFAGIKAGKRAGMKVIGLSTTNSEESLQGKVDKIIPNFENVTVETILN